MGHTDKSPMKLQNTYCEPGKGCRQMEMRTEALEESKVKDPRVWARGRHGTIMIEPLASHYERLISSCKTASS